MKAIHKNSHHIYHNSNDVDFFSNIYTNFVDTSILNLIKS